MHFLKFENKEKVQSPIYYQNQIEKSKNEQLEKIRANTKEQLNLLKQKYSTNDKIGSSFALLAYIIIGLFVALILLNDLIKLVTFVVKRQKGKWKLAIRNELNQKIEKTEIDREKLDQLDERIFRMSLELKKSLHSRKTHVNKELEFN